MEKIQNAKLLTKTLVATGMLIAMAVIFRALGIMVPVAGSASMRISIDGVFYKLPGLIFGPAYGAIAGGLADVIAYIIHPQGAYIPLMTLTTILNGFLPAVLYNRLKDIPSEKLEKRYIYISSVIGILGILNIVLVSQMPHSYISKSINMLGSKSQLLQLGLLIIAIVGFIPVIINIIIKRANNKSSLYDNFLSIITAIGIPGLIVSTLNTYILKLFIPALSGKAFMLLWAPRIVEQIFVLIIESFILAILLVTYNKHIKVKTAK